MVRANVVARNEVVEKKINITLDEGDFFNLFFFFICYFIMDLIDAVRSGDIQNVRELLDRGADPNSRGRFGNTALIVAAWNGLTEIVELLLDRGADPNFEDNIGRTALIEASEEDHAEIIRG